MSGSNIVPQKCVALIFLFGYFIVTELYPKKILLLVLGETLSFVEVPGCLRII